MVRPSALAVLRLMINSYVGRQLDRQVGRLGALENSIHVICCSAEMFDVVSSIADQASGLNKLSSREHRWQPVTSGDAYELPFLLPERWIGRDDHSLRMLIGNLVEGGLSRLSIDVQATSHGVHQERETAAGRCYAQEPVNSVSRTAREAGA
jgi:hypothetical protein